MANFIDLQNNAEPSSPASGFIRLFADSGASDILKFKDSAGNVRLATATWSAVPTHILFAADNTYDIGDASHAARDIYLDGKLKMGAAASQVVPGGTSFAIRNNADSANNLHITDAGTVTIRGALVPAANGTQDFGTNDTRWRNGYFGGSVGVLGDINSAGEITAANGSASEPGLAFTSNPTYGLFFSSSAVRVAVGGTERAAINATGLGVGVSTPQGRLHVYDTDAGMLFWRTSGLGSTPVQVLSGISYYAHIIGGYRSSTGATVGGFDCTLTLNTVFDLSDSQPFDGNKFLYAALSAGGVLTVYLDVSILTGWSLSMQVIYS